MALKTPSHGNLAPRYHDENLLQSGTQTWELTGWQLTDLEGHDGALHSWCSEASAWRALRRRGRRGLLGRLLRRRRLRSVLRGHLCCLLLGSHNLCPILDLRR